ncbi:Vps36-domain-containing protein [Xylona heveae TC161]|uniref:Vacuolar protein-sorting-associated protein 36 n=1 Tax=Xylona heveae (strain CBS 132557 / TC161) TaxID=1328760 RepID=A0A165IWT8_XYLHT|nr:Vps36-domain-containing protein [Xylona heveae TC161]KZF25484.1 Vps36-domain-containing protein [Xylona heveae TC161]
MTFQQIDLTTALRPSLLPDETLLFVQDSVGLYEGKYKLSAYQNGHAYLTSHRACYVDNEEPRKYSVGIQLKDVDRFEFYAGFLKSSPKITLHLKPSRLATQYAQSPTANLPFRSASASPVSRSDSSLRPPPPPPPSVSNATWICPICSFSNPVPSNFDPAIANIHTPLPPCLACGIKPPLLHVIKAAIASASNRSSLNSQTPASQAAPALETSIGAPAPVLRDARTGDSPSYSNSHSAIACPRCTFHNHPSLVNCEICGASLVSVHTTTQSLLEDGPVRVDSPGPSLKPGSTKIGTSADSIKFSFRAGGEKIFLERLKSAMVQRKWLLQGAPPIPRPVHRAEEGAAEPSGRTFPPAVQRNVGIAALERRGQEIRKNNELVIGNAFEDLEALMTSAKEIVALAESFASQARSSNDTNSSEADALLSQSASALGLVTTRDMLGSGSNSESLYISELSRNLAEFLTDDARGVLRREGGMMSLVDLWALFNRARGGVELVSPLDFEKAAQLWEKLKLPVRLRTFRSGLLVVQGRDWNDDKIIDSIVAWLHQSALDAFSPELQWDRQLFGRGVTASETAERFGWSVGVATEELEMAEERGALCREESVEGVKFWENAFMKHV